MVNIQELKKSYAEKQKAYVEWSSNGQAAFDKLPIYFAFGDDQFKRVLADLGYNADNKNHLKKFVGIGAGGFMLKSDKHLLTEYLKEGHGIAYFKKHYSVEDLEGAIWYELFNHELTYNYDIDEEMQDLFGFNDDEIKIYNRVKRDALNYICYSDDYC